MSARDDALFSVDDALAPAEEHMGTEES